MSKNLVSLLLSIVFIISSETSQAKRLRNKGKTSSASALPIVPLPEESSAESAAPSTPVLNSSSSSGEETHRRRQQKPPADENGFQAVPMHVDIYKSAPKKQLSMALELMKQNRFQQAAILLYNLARRSELKTERPQIKYILGMLLLDHLHLPQVAAFQFVEVIKMNDSKYTKLAVEKLSSAADILGDDTTLNYAITKVQVDDFPDSERDMLYYRMGELALKSQQFEKADELFAKVPPGSPYLNKALYNRGIALMEIKQLDKALQIFKSLVAIRKKAGPVDTNKVAAQLALARVYYQKQEWDAAIEAYSQIPRDHVLWHDAFFEQSWAMFRGARFRSAISNFQSLHTPYYDDFYIPESLLLRSIVYLYICKYDEMEKVLNLFEKIYGPASLKIADYLKNNSDMTAFYNELEKAVVYRRTPNSSYGGNLPYVILKNIMDEGDVKRSLNYVQRLTDEKSRIDSNGNLKTSQLGQAGIRIINNRIKNTRISLGEMVKYHLNSIQVDLKDYSEQASFIRYEMINGKREAMKKKMSGKELKQDQIDEKMDRDFFVSNGYDFYPFQGEYWLDEIGNFHFLGKQSCE